MKKLIAVTASIAMSTIAFETFAQEIAANTPKEQPATIAVAVQDENKVAVKKEELPDAIQKVLSSDAMQGAEFVSAYLIKGEKAIYEITISKEGQQATFKMDETGTVIQ